MSILKNRILRTIAVLGCAAMCGVMLTGCNNEESNTPASGGAMAPKSGGEAPAATTPGSGG